ncbi:Prenylcysteine oxidase [Pseudovirgaria hyperparasitica]|uniref:Prenylcysteine oxidase n=1 Tax=Pseudovirgaria hyperparasitica TaxID=470096 RepID=A0A6A6W7H0_9PEZI|nr:Prenylcysteine oxidase [Pseudovirgaria hyperparasitica]KAF2758159.1 Prenylcysteine oxidase [Pseudovirgaria hyperparasitica]
MLLYPWSCAVLALLLADNVSSENAHAKLHQHAQQPMIKSTPKRVAIIGAGAGGSSTAYHLHQFAAAAGIPIDITIFEKNPYIGGRTTTVNAWDTPGEPIELGGAIFVKANKIMVEAAQAFNLTATKLSSVKPPSGTSNAPELGVWNGEEFVFEQTGSWWDVPKLLWRYGYAPVRTNNLVKDVMARFLRMYEAPVFPWTSLSDVAYELGLTEATAVTGEQYLQANGVGKLFADEIVQASTRVNYAQNLPVIHGLDTMVSMAAQGAMSIDGGNWQIFANMVQTAAAHIHLNTTVSAVHRAANGSFSLTTTTTSSSTSLTTPPFDTIVLAAPFHSSSITFSPRLTRPPDAVPYVHLHVTLFASPHSLSPSAFNLPANTPVPKTILTTLRHTADTNSTTTPPFYSISTLRHAPNPQSHTREALYKIFSPAPISDAYIAHLLGLGPSPPSSSPQSQSDYNLAPRDVSWLKRHEWDSYPIAFPRVSFEELWLGMDVDVDVDVDVDGHAGGVWYTSGMEGFISTMETSALVGMDVARLVVDGWGGERG